MAEEGKVPGQNADSSGSTPASPPILIEKRGYQPQASGRPEGINPPKVIISNILTSKPQDK